MSDDELAKDLGPLAALTIGVGTMIGAGIFVLPGIAAGEAGPLVAISFVVGGVISLFTALSASELGTAMPRAGGAYYYINHALGPLFGSIAGLGNWMGLAFASAFYMLGFGSYVNTFLPVPTVVLAGVEVLTPAQLAALLAGAFFVAVNYVGAKETGRLQNVIVLVLVAILTVFSILGFLQADLSMLRPVDAQGWGSVLPGTALVFVSYLGFVQITTVGEEIKNPGRNLPLAVIGSVLLVTTIYAIVIVMMMGVIPWGDLAALVETDGEGAPVIEVARLAFGIVDVEILGVGFAAVGVGLITFAGLLATASSANASILASSRINFAMGRDKLVTAWLNEIHPRFATPYRSILVTGGLILALILVRNVEILANAGAVLHLVVYGLLNLALIVMREANPPDYDPSFRVPLYPITPAVGAFTSFGLIAFNPPLVIGLAAAFALGGIVWYVAYGRRHTPKQGILGQYVQERSDALPDSAVSAAGSVQPDGGTYRVMVPLANPEHETSLVKLAAAIASQRDGTLVATHIVQVPDQTPLGVAAERGAEIDPSSAQLLESAEADADAAADVPVETHTIYSHRGFDEIFDAARTYDADLLVMGWGPDSHGSPGRAESAIDEVAGSLPCDVLVFRDRGFDPGRILVPTAGGPDSDLSVEVARYLRAEFDAELTLLHVADGSRSEAEDFLAAWADEHDLGDAERLVESGDVEAAIERAAADHTLLVLGATEQGLLSRLVRGTLVLDVISEVECSVVLAEKRRSRSLRERLFG